MLQWRNDSPISGRWEGSQLKAEADRKAHHAWLNALGILAPDIPVISEEGDLPQVTERPSRYFLIDPIDGTASYAEGFSGFVTQVAYFEERVVKIAVVYAPALDLCWHAQKGLGAFLNNQRLAKAHTERDRLLLIDNYPEPRGITKKLFDALPATGYLESGSIGLKICHVAAGTADLFIKDVIVRDWDLAPGTLILEEAGGLLLDIHGKPFIYSGSFEKSGLVAGLDSNLLQRSLSCIGNTSQSISKNPES